ncbi:MAG: AraC family transcriptional regulator ligand-binding domain-containing protein [Rubrivivax sp.]
MTQAQTVIATWLVAVLEQFAARGIGTRGLSEGSWLHDACRRAPTRQLSLVVARRLWQQAAQQSGDPLLGLKVGAALPLQAMNVVALLIMQSACLRQALELTLRYQSLVSNSGRFTATPLPGGLRLNYQVMPCPVAMHASQIDSVFAGYLSLLAHCTPPGVKPRMVALPGQGLQLRAAYEAALGCPVVLGAADAWFEFDDEALDRPFLAADPHLLRLAQTRADDMLRAQGHAESLTDHVQAALAAQGFGPGNCARVARALGLSTRTLQRRLAAAGTSFRQQAEAARMNEALRLLADATLPLASLCEALGYSEPSALSHAVRSYWGTSPSALRAELKAGHKGTARLVA